MAPRLALGQRRGRSREDRVRWSGRRLPLSRSTRSFGPGRPPASCSRCRPRWRLAIPILSILAPLAKAGGSKIIHAANVNAPAVIEALAEFQTDLALVIGWSQICGNAFRSIARIGNIGFHPAPIPRTGPGGDPWTILLGEHATAASLFWLDDGVEFRSILLQEPIAVAADETARTHVRQADRRARAHAAERCGAGAIGQAATDRTGSSSRDLLRRTDARRWLDRLARTGRGDTAPRPCCGRAYPGAFTTCGERRLVIDIAPPLADSHRYFGLPGQVQCRHATRLCSALRCRRQVDVTSLLETGSGSRQATRPLQTRGRDRVTRQSGNDR